MAHFNQGQNPNMMNISPQLFQQQQQQQQQGAGGQQANPGNFAQHYQAFQRLQSQESAKIDQQQRMGGPSSGMANAMASMSQLAAGMNPQQQQQFMAQMRGMQQGQQMAFGQQGGGGSGSGGSAQTLNFAQLQQIAGNSGSGGGGINPNGGAAGTSSNNSSNNNNINGNGNGGQLNLAAMGLNPQQLQMQGLQSIQGMQAMQGLQGMQGMGGFQAGGGGGGGSGGSGMQQQQGMQGMGNIAQQMQALQGVNLHSLQQGLGLGETEKERRHLLQTMLAQQLASQGGGGVNPQGQPLTPQLGSNQQLQQQQQIQSQQQHQQPGMSNALSSSLQALQNSNLSPDTLQFLLRIPTHIRDPVFAKHNNNLQAALNELIQNSQYTANLRAQQQGQQPQQPQQPLHQQQQQQQQQGQQAGGQQGQIRQPQQISVNGQMPQQQQGQQPPQQQQQQQQQQGTFGQGRPQQQQQPGHQRMGSEGGYNMNAQGMQIDPKQFEILQQMKQRQERQNLLTPQAQNAQSLPMLSPQQSMQQPQGQNQQQQQQQQQNYGQAPPTPSQQRGQQAQPGSGSGSVAPAASSQQGVPPGLRSAQMQNQQLPSGSQGQQTPLLSQGGVLPSPVQGGGSNLQTGAQQPQQQAGNKGSNIADVVAGWNNEQLMRNTTGILSRIQETNSSERNDPSKFYLLQLIAEFKRRNMPIPSQALSQATNILGNQAAVNQLLKADWQVLFNFAQNRVQNATKSAAAASAAGAGGTNAQIPQSGPMRQNISQPGQPGTGASSSNPIDMITPQLGGSSTPMLPNVQHPPFTPGMQAQNLPGGGGAAGVGGMDEPQQPRQQQLPAQQRHPSFGQQALTQAQLAQLAQMQMAQQQNAGQSLPAPFATPQQQARQLAQQPAQGQQQPPQSSSHVGGNVPAPSQGGQQQKKPWANMDFRDEPVPMSEELFWETVKKLLKNPGLATPVIEGKGISVYLLFSLVHKNGGSAKIDQNPVIWQRLAGHLGLGTEPQQPHSTPQVAQQLRHVYTLYCAQIEEMFYAKLYATRQKKAAEQFQALQAAQQASTGQTPQSQSQALPQVGQQPQQQVMGQGSGPGSVNPSVQAWAHQQQQLLAAAAAAQQQQQQQQQTQQQSANQQVPPTPQQLAMQALAQQRQEMQQQQGQGQGSGQGQQQQQPLPPNMSAQFLEALAKNQALSDQQKRYIEEAQRRQSYQQQQQQQQQQRTGSVGPGQTPQMGMNALPSSTAGGTNNNNPTMPLSTPTPGSMAPPSTAPLPSSATLGGGAGQSMPVPQVPPGLTPQQQQQWLAAQAHAAAQNNSMAENAIRGIRNNPNAAYGWIKNREDIIKQKMASNKPVPLSEEDRLRLLAELRTLSVVAREAQERMPKYLLLAAERGVEEFKELTGMVSVYSIIILVHQKAEQGVNVFSPNDVRKVQVQLNNLLILANRIMEEYRTARGPEALERLFAALQPRPSANALVGGGTPVLDPKDVRPPAPTQPVAVDQAGTPLNPAVAASLPKGLRVEDLKPPTAKRQRMSNAGANTTAGGNSKSSPAMPHGGAPTPETAKTPAKTPTAGGGGAGSPLAAAGASSNTSPAGRGKPAAKRKRAGTAVTKAKAAEAAAAAAAANASTTSLAKSTSSAAAQQMPPPPPAHPSSSSASAAMETNALGLEVPQHAEFFRARKELESGQADVWVALADAVQGYNAAAAASAAAAAAAATGGGGATAAGPAAEMTDDELFAQFMDIPQPFHMIPPVIDPALLAASAAAIDFAGSSGSGGGTAPVTGGGVIAEWPTPELYFAPSSSAYAGGRGDGLGDGEGDGDDAAGTDTSPESIKTVGSTTGPLPPPPPPAAAAGRRAAAGKGAGSAAAMAGAMGGRLSDHMLLPLSPMTQAYNGGLFAWEDADYEHDQAAVM